MRRFCLACLTAALALALHGCASINVDLAAQRTESRAIPQSKPGKLQKLAYKPSSAKPGESAFVLLESGLDALAARLWLAEKAEKTLDLQYYIFHGDKTGAVLADALMRAADRGVRVRLLLDDIYTHRHEASIMALYAHPNIEIRLFNPFHFRGGNPLLQLSQYLNDQRLNRRMHNKLFAADNQFAITGGRNIGDEYFVAHDEFSFVDLDVMASGPVVAELSDSFDAYWASNGVVPANALPGYRQASAKLPALKEALKRKRIEHEQSDYGRELKVIQFEQRLLSGRLPRYLGLAAVVADPPEKAEGEVSVSKLLVGRLANAGIDAENEMIVISPYFVPGRLGVDWMGYLRARGARVRVLTNSLAASDVPVVHAGYARYRKDLLKLGVELHELKPLDNAPKKKTRIIGSGSSRSSLHAKSLVFDRERVFIGSFNFDPRSAWLNTELGLVITSAAAAKKVAELAERAMGPLYSYRLSLEQPGDAIAWTSRTESGETVSYAEPDTSWLKRRWVDFLMTLPLEEHL